MSSTFRVSTVDKSFKPEGRTCTDCLFIIIYKICKTQTVPFLVVIAHHSSSGLASHSARVQMAVWLVNPRQLLHDLNDLVHCGFTLHAAAVIDLKSSDTKQ